MNLGQAIVILRKQRNLSQEQLAFNADISRHFMYRLENNRASPTVKTLEKIGAALGLQPSEILLEAQALPSAEADDWR